jgi:hypothetical protein
LTLAGFGLIACGEGAVPIGTFRGERPVEVNPGTDPIVAMQLRRLQITLDAEGNATLEDGGIPSEGRASRRGDTLTVDLLAVSGINIDRQPADFPRSRTLRVVDERTLELDGVRLVRR